MLPINAFHLRIRPAYTFLQKVILRMPFYPFQSELYFNNINCHLIVDGIIIHAQFAIQQGYLLLTSTNNEFTPDLEIYLLDKTFKVIDHLYLACHYLSNAAGSLGNLTILNDHQLSFTFLNFEEKLILTLYDEPQRKIILRNPIPYLHYRWQARLGGKHYMDLMAQD